MEMQTDNPGRPYRDPTATPDSGLSPEVLALAGAQNAGDVSRVRSILSSLPPGTSLHMPPEQFLANARFRSASNDLRDANISGDVEKVRSIIEAWRNDPSLKDPAAEDMESTMIRAAASGNAEIVRFFLDEGVPVGRMAPSSARMEGDDSGPVGVFQAFLDHGWDINSFDNIPVLKYKPHPHKPKYACEKLTSPSSLATESLQLTKWFLAHGADPNLISKWGHTPLDTAASKSHPDVYAVIDVLIASGALLTHSNPLHNALVAIDTDSASFEMMEFLLSKGVEINGLSFANRPEFHKWNPSTPLHWAVRWHHKKRGRKNMYARIKWLLDHGADAGLRDSKGKRPLEEATRKDEKLIELLNDN